MKFLIRVSLYFWCIFCHTNSSAAQESRQVLWNFSVDYGQHEKITLIARAHIIPGWHLYSQYGHEDGPIPTTFSFERSESYILIGRPEEKGKAVKTYNDLYEMDITWYTGQVYFLQKVKLLKPVSAIKGIIDYMTCNDHVCIPFKQEFIITINPIRKMP